MLLDEPVVPLSQLPPVEPLESEQFLEVRGKRTKKKTSTRRAGTTTARKRRAIRPPKEPLFSDHDTDADVKEGSPIGPQISNDGSISESRHRGAQKNKIRKIHTRSTGPILSFNDQQGERESRTSSENGE
jgi:hypothetical protein